MHQSQNALLVCATLIAATVLPASRASGVTGEASVSADGGYASVAIEDMLEKWQGHAPPNISDANLHGGMARHHRNVFAELAALEQTVADGGAAAAALDPLAHTPCHHGGMLNCDPDLRRPRGFGRFKLLQGSAEGTKPHCDVFTHDALWLNEPNNAGAEGFRERRVQCEPGAFCVDGDRYECPPGRFGASPGLKDAACSGQCAGGYYCPAGSTSAFEKPCGDGRAPGADTPKASVFCPPGSGNPTPAAPGFYTSRRPRGPAPDFGGGDFGGGSSDVPQPLWGHWEGQEHVDGPSEPDRSVWRYGAQRF